jgi:NAD(P)H-dependent flavin oxidoreductase YrpB (nitropropane dioxygenase family)
MIIQGGMGVAISNYRLANAVSKVGQLGVISGTGVAMIMIARLMNGDSDGSTRRALANFPYPDVAQRILTKFFVEGGVKPNVPYKRLQMWSLNPNQELQETTVVANFVEVFLAKEGHNNPVGINLLEKVQLPNLASLYGAMLAGVDVVIMGAGVPIQVAGILDDLTQHKDVRYRLDVLNATADDEYYINFSPTGVFPNIDTYTGTLKRPSFLPIISSVVLAQALIKRSTGSIQGFVIEGPTAGGHNAPPRGQMQLNDKGEPIYGDRDLVDLKKMREIGYPFWLAGGYGTPDKLQDALAEGAAGIQVGTAFAYCDESGMAALDKYSILEKVYNRTVEILTDPVASPTGFPFKVAKIVGTLADKTVYNARERICDIGFLRHLYKLPDGKLGYRCPAEPVDQYVNKGGQEADTVGRMCLCNNLGAAAGYPQRRNNGEYLEPSLITSGDDLVNLGVLMKPGQMNFSAQDVIAYLLAKDSQNITAFVNTLA